MRNAFFRLTCIAVLAAAETSSFAKEFVKPDDVVPKQLNAQQKQRLKEAWDKDGLPTLQVVVGNDVNGIITDSHTALETQLNASIRERLASSIDPGLLVDATTLWTQQMRDVQAVANQTGKQIAEVVAEESRNDDHASIVLFVHLQSQGNGYAVTLDVVDPARAAQLAAASFLTIRPTADTDIINGYATSIVGKFIEQYASRVLDGGGGLYTYRIRIIGIDSDEQADAIASAMKKIDGVVGRIEHSYTTAAGDIGVASYTVVMKDADPSELKVSLTSAIKANVEGHSLVVSRSNRGSVIGAMFDSTPPDWWVVTSEKPVNGYDRGSEQEKREKAMGLSRRLKVAVVVGPALQQPAMQFEDASTPLKTSFDEGQLRDALQSYMTSAGFDAVDDVSLKDAKQLAQQQYTRFANVEHLNEAANDRKDFEYLLYCDETGEGDSKRYEFRLIDRLSTSVIATQPWPDAAARQAIPLYQPKDNQPKSVARYVCGNLLTQLNSRLIDKRATMQVIVKNTDDVVKIARIADVFRNVANVKAVQNMNYSLPVGGFEITFDGSSDALLQALTAQMPKLALPLSIDTFGDRQMAINLNRKVGPEKTVEVQKKEIEVIKESPKGKTLAQHLVEARSSVWVVGWMSKDGKFQSEGTAWTVAPQRLATNVHVANGLLEGAEINGTPVARRGDDESVVVKLGKATCHPGYAAWDKLTDSFTSLGTSTDISGISPCDVAIVEVIDGNAGKPLAIASAQQMNALLPADPIGYLGFPMENKRNVDEFPTLMTDVGTVSAYTDVFHQPRAANDLGLLQYTLRTAGGASGSPVFGFDGEVVALNSAGDSQDMLSNIKTAKPNVFVVTKADGTIARKGGKVLVAILNRPGAPLEVAEETYQIRESTKARNLESGEHVVTFSPKEIKFDENGQVTTLYDMRRVNFGFCYGQSVDMLRELMDGTAEQKQVARTAAWQQRAEQLHLMKHG